MDIKEFLLQWFTIFYKKSSGCGIVNEIISNNELAEKLHKLIIKNFKKKKVGSSCIDKIWGADLAGMHLISKFNKVCGCLLCVIDKELTKKLTKKFQLLTLFKKFLKNLIENQRKYG